MKFSIAMFTRRILPLAIMSVPLTLLLLSACGGGGGGSATGSSTHLTPSYSIGGNISGLTGSVVLQNNGGDNLTVTASGAFTFATKVASGGAYSVSVLTQPAGMTCSVSAGTGTGTVSAIVSNVTVVCSINTYSVGGTITGLTAGNSITLTNKGTDNLTLSASGVSQAFTFATNLANGVAYNLTLSNTTPTAQPCTSTYGAGTINAANFTGMNVICGVAGGLSTFTGTGSMATARQSHTATLLPNGKVLVSGGMAASPLASAELYDPVAGTWSATGSMAAARVYHTATLLPNGKVLVAGGVGAAYFASAELYDPVTGTWSTTSQMAAAREGHTATLLPNGRVLVAAGVQTLNLAVMPTCLASAELYDPATGAWSVTAMVYPRCLHTATLLPNGRVLVSGGFNGTSTTASAELYW